MLLYEKINQILKEKNISKKDFALKLLELEPTLKSTGEAPSMPTIYNYLNGTREIKADIVPYIAKALDISEQELFLDEENIVEFFSSFIKNYDINDDSKTSLTIHLVNLCEYAPKPLLEKIITTLEKQKELTINSIKNLRI